MNKTFKRLILLLAFVFSVCSFAVFAVACNDGATPGSENITYSVTVTATKTMFMMASGTREIHSWSSG